MGRGLSIPCLVLCLCLCVSAVRDGFDMDRHQVEPWGGWSEEPYNASKLIARSAPTLPDDFTKYWMTYLWEYIKDQAINRIWMPGTHNAAMYDVTTAIRPPGFEGDYDNGCVLQWDVAGLVYAPWSKTQGKSITEQIHDGSRYFDFRITNTYEGGERNFKFIHCVLSKATVAQELRKISEYLSTQYSPANAKNGQSPKEVITLNFYQFANFLENKDREENYKLNRDFMKLVVDCFKPGQIAILDENDYEYANPKKVPTLAEMTADGPKVMLIYNVGAIYNWTWDAMDPDIRKYFVKQHAFMERNWGEKNRLKDLMDYSYGQYTSYRTREDKFFIMEAVLTPAWYDTLVNTNLYKYEAGVGEAMTMWLWDDLYWWFYGNTNSDDEKSYFKPFVLMLDFLDPLWSTMIALVNTHKDKAYFIPGYYGKCSADYVTFSGCEMNPSKGRGWFKCAEGYPYTKSNKGLTTCWCQCCRDPELQRCGCNLQGDKDGDLGKCW